MMPLKTRTLKVILALVLMGLLLSHRVDLSTVVIISAVAWPLPPDAYRPVNGTTLMGIIVAMVVLGVLSMVVPAPASAASRLGAVALALLMVGLWCAVLSLMELVVISLIRRDRTDHAL